MITWLEYLMWCSTIANIGMTVVNMVMFRRWKARIVHQERRLQTIAHIEALQAARMEVIAAQEARLGIRAGDGVSP